MYLVLEQIEFKQGDDANRALAILYPDQDGVSTGWTSAESIAATIEYMAQWDYGEPCEGFRLTDVNSYRLAQTDHYVLEWDYGYTNICLYRKPSSDVDYSEAADEFAYANGWEVRDADNG